MSLLLALALAAPVQVLPSPAPPVTTDPLSYLPADSLLIVQFDPGPWKRLGPATQAHALFQHEGLRGFLAQIECPEFSWDLLGNYSITAGIGLSDLLAGRVLLVIEPVAGVPQLDAAAFDDFPLVAQEDGITVHGATDAAAWCRDGQRTLLLLRFPGLGHEDHGFHDDAAWLVSRIAATRSQEGGAATLPSVAGMRQVIESEQDLFRLYVPLEEWTMDNFGLLAGFDPSVLPFDFRDFFTPFGLDKIEGVGWTTSIAGSQFRDKILAYGEEPMACLYAGSYPAGDEAPLARLDALPGDATLATLTRFNMLGLMQAMEELFDNIFQSLGGDLDDIKLFGWMGTAIEIAGTLGDEMVGVQRAEDLWERRNGALWFELDDPAAFQALLAKLPPEFLDLARQGFDAGPGSYRFGLSVEGNRVYFARSLAEEEADGTLGESRSYRELRPWLAERLLAGGVNSLGYLGPEMAAEGFDVLRRDGLPPELVEILPITLDFSGLPDFDFVASKIGGTATVSRAIPEGLLVETVSPLGYLGTILVNPAIIDAILRGMGGQSPFGPPFDSNAFDEDF